MHFYQALNVAHLNECYLNIYSISMVRSSKSEFRHIIKQWDLLFVSTMPVVQFSVIRPVFATVMNQVYELDVTSSLSMSFDFFKRYLHCLWSDRIVCFLNRTVGFWSYDLLRHYLLADLSSTASTISLQLSRL